MRVARSTHLAVAFIALIVLGGCVSDEPTRRPPPAQPEQIAPSAVQIFLSLPEDTNANSYVDTVMVTVYLFADGYAPSVFVQGEFQFRLLNKDGTEVAQWTITREASQASVRRLPPGPGYMIQLNLLDRGTDQIPSNPLDLYCSFTPTGGKTVHARPHTLRYGRIGT